MRFKFKFNFQYFLSFFLLFLLTIRSSNIREILPNIIFYVTIIFINFYIILKQKPIINRLSLYFYTICFFSLLINYALGYVNPVLDSWLRLFIFILVFNITGPFLVNNYSINFRSIIYKMLIYFIPLLFIIDSFFIIYFRKITPTGEAEGFFESPNLSGVISAITIFIFLNKYFLEHKFYKKIFYILFTFSGFPILFASASRSALLSLFVILFLMIYKYGIKKFIPFFIITIITSLLLYSKVEPFLEILIQKIEIRNESGDVTAGRSTMYSDNIEDFTSNPIFGSGFYNMIHYKNSKINDDGSLEYPSSWLFLLSTLGLLGLLYFIYIIYIYIKLFIKLNNSSNFKFITLSLLTFFFIHINFEGYIFSGGGILFVLFWLLVSNSFNLLSVESYSNNS